MVTWTWPDGDVEVAWCCRCFKAAVDRQSRRGGSGVTQTRRSPSTPTAAGRSRRAPTLTCPEQVRQPRNPRSVRQTRQSVTTTSVSFRFHVHVLATQCTRIVLHTYSTIHVRMYMYRDMGAMFSFAQAPTVLVVMSGHRWMFGDVFATGVFCRSHDSGATGSRHREQSEHDERLLPQHTQHHL